MTTQQTVKIQLVRSPIGTKESHRATVRGLGLRKLNSVSELQDTPCSARHDQQDQLSGQNPLRDR
jgi:large subunit ribosomal protein L30